MTVQDDIRKFLEFHAERNGLELNPDVDQQERVIKGLASNRVKHGKPYCPCRVRTGDAKLDQKIVCPCEFYPEEIDMVGHCHCNLFFKKGEDT